MTELVDTLIKRMKPEQKERLGKSNIELLHKYDKQLILAGIRKVTREGLISTIRQLGVVTGKNYNKITKEDVQNFIISRKNYKIERSTIASYQMKIRKFYRTICDEEPDCISWIQHPQIKAKEKKASDMLNEDEVKRMIDFCLNDRDKCLISLIWDSAIRIGEACNLKIKNVQINGDLVFISVTGKTGSREIQLLLSAPMMLKYIENHPSKHILDAPLFISFNHKNKMKPLTIQGAHFIVKNVAKTAGIKKRVSPHIFRHSKLTDLVKKGMQESYLRQFAGWSKSSKMVETYIHLAPDDVHNSRRYLEVGKKPVEVHKPSVLLPIECPRCKKMNDATNKYCEKCWYALDDQSARRDIKILNTFRSPWIQKAKGLDVDSMIDEYYRFENMVTEMTSFFKGFHSKSSIDLHELRNELNWNKPKFNRVMEMLIEYKHVKVEDGHIVIQKYYFDGREKSIFENFVTIQKRYLKPL